MIPNIFSLFPPPPRPKIMKIILIFHVKNFCVSRIVCIFATAYNNSSQQKYNLDTNNKNMDTITSHN